MAVMGAVQVDIKDIKEIRPYQATVILKCGCEYQAYIPELQIGNGFVLDEACDTHRCKLREDKEWFCGKLSGHDGVCSCHNDCGEMWEGMVCGRHPDHLGQHSWELLKLLKDTFENVHITNPEIGQRFVEMFKYQGIST